MAKGYPFMLFVTPIYSTINFDNRLITAANFAPFLEAAFLSISQKIDFISIVRSECVQEL